MRKGVSNFNELYPLFIGDINLDNLVDFILRKSASLREWSQNLENWDRYSTAFLLSWFPDLFASFLS